MLPKSLSVMLAASLFVASPAVAQQPDVMVPVNSVLKMAETVFSEAPDGTPVDDGYLSEKSLQANFSTGFIAEYKRGIKRAQETDEPFLDYDPVSGSQDGCPLKDVSVGEVKQTGKVYEVSATFKSIYCFGDEFANETDETRFRVVIEGGEPKIDDIINVYPDAEPNSLRQVMNEYFEE